LCKDLVWYKSWWNTVKGLFGSKATNCTKAAKKLAINLVAAVSGASPAVISAAADDDGTKPKVVAAAKPVVAKVAKPVAKAVSAAKPVVAKVAKPVAKAASILCKDLVWYKSWWNYIKAMYGSKPTNCTAAAKLVDLGSLLCKNLAWYKRWWNTIKGWFGSKPSNCISLKASRKIMLNKGRILSSKVTNSCTAGDASTCLCKDLAFYLGWWNTVKGWFGSKTTNCVDLKKMSAINLTAALQKGSTNTCSAGNVATCLCKDLAFYSRWWNSLKGLFGSKATNCNSKLTKKRALELLLASNVSVNSCSAGIAAKCLCKDLAFYLGWWNTVKGWFGSKATNCNEALNKKKMFKFEPTFFNKYAEVFRSKGLPMELYTKPVATDLLEKMPNFVDNTPMNEGIKFYNEFVKAKNVLLSLDQTDAQFLNYVEKFIMTWAVTPEMELSKLHELY